MANLAKAQADPSDTEMAKFVALARSDDERFRFVRKFDCELLVMCDAGKAEQLVLPCGHGFRQLVMEELHCSPTGGHWGVTKMLTLALARVWWPRMRQTIARFVRGCHVCQVTKPSTQKPTGLMQPLPVP